MTDQEENKKFAIELLTVKHPIRNDVFKKISPHLEDELITRAIISYSLIALQSSVSKAIDLRRDHITDILQVSIAFLLDDLE